MYCTPKEFPGLQKLNQVLVLRLQNQVNIHKVQKDNFRRFEAESTKFSPPFLYRPDIPGRKKSQRLLRENSRSKFGGKPQRRETPQRPAAKKRPWQNKHVLIQQRTVHGTDALALVLQWLFSKCLGHTKQ